MESSSSSFRFLALESILEFSIFNDLVFHTLQYPANVTFDGLFVLV